MKRITVKTARQYDIMIGSALLKQTGNLVAAAGIRGNVAIISDTNVWPLYGAVVADSLRSAGFDVKKYVMPAGENSKNSTTYLALLDFLAGNRLGRNDVVIALGGGVVGDIAGFAAATYLRGISYIQIPTTLLAMVDSSVGGKTGINLAIGKNLVGAFYQPRLVICDIDTLNLLPLEHFCDGCAEVIKYGILYDKALFEHLQAMGTDFDKAYVVSRCVELKAAVVAQDEFDRAERQKLNLGHTIGHSIEACSGYAVTHGQAVAIGMATICKAGVTMGISANDAYDQILSILRQFGLPTETTFDADTLYQLALSDKKHLGDTIHLIMPKSIGNCVIQPTPITELKTIFEAGI